jgi:transketolase
MEMVGLEDTFGESGKPYELVEKYGLTPENIFKKSKILLDRKNK